MHGGDRRLRVVNNGYFSQWYAINAGVPQGAVYSPFLYIISGNHIDMS
jgi:hypothetical protein